MHHDARTDAAAASARRRPEAAARVAAARAQTVAAGSARLLLASRVGELDHDASDERGQGVVDLVRRRALVRERLVPERAVEQGGADPPSDARTLQFLRQLVTVQEEVLYEGANRRVRVEDGWWDEHRPLDGPLAPDHPLWLLDALAGADDAVVVGTDTVRDAAAERLRLAIDLATADRQSPQGLVVPGHERDRRERDRRERDRIPGRGGRPPTAAQQRGDARAGERRFWRRRARAERPERVPAELWLDQQGRVRRLACAPFAAVAPEEPTLWVTLELWDFGIELEIPEVGALEAAREPPG